MKSPSMGTFKEYHYENNNALLAWISENYKQISPNKFLSINDGCTVFSRKELITRAAAEEIVARQWATLEIAHLSLTESDSK